MPTFVQDCFRGQLSMSWVGTRAIDQPNTKPSEKVNPRGTHGHTLKIDISSLDSEDSTIIDASKYKGNHRVVTSASHDPALAWHPVLRSELPRSLSLFSL
jgi:hypothetical protein